MGVKPVAGNGLDKSCGETISSNCVSWAGPSIPGTCGKPTLTDVISAISASTGCCDGDFGTGHISAYTGQWVDFSTGIPLSGSGPYGSYTISAFGSTIFSTTGGFCNNPQYKWTREGDLLLRGSLRLIVTPAQVGPAFTIPMVNLLPANFPVGWTATQSILTSMDFNTYNMNNNLIVEQFVTIEYPSGLLSATCYFNSINMQPFGTTLNLGGCRFNIA